MHTFVVQNFDAGAKPDVLKHVVDFDFSAGESGPAGRHGDVVNTGRSAEDESDADRGRGDLNGLGARYSRLATRHVLRRHRERLLRVRPFRSDENVFAVSLYDHASRR